MSCNGGDVRFTDPCTSAAPVATCTTPSSSSVLTAGHAETVASQLLEDIASLKKQQHCTKQAAVRGSDKDANKAASESAEPTASTGPEWADDVIGITEQNE